MKLQSLGIFKSNQLFQKDRSKLRWMEWLIAIFFIVTLLIGSGIFVKASNAADLKVKNYHSFSLNKYATIPGAMHAIYQTAKTPVAQAAMLTSVEDDDSCELKPEV